ncbi:MAG TPA: RNA-binding protein [Leptolyngbya sp.]|jgi:RNA recognition motif-containing protein|nr:RNA-binding protein [Leptolyngbya sp.]
MAIIVSNLPSVCSEAELKELFQPYGEIQNLKFSDDKTSVSLQLSEGEDRAIKALDQTEWKGQTLQFQSPRGGDDPP